MCALLGPLNPRSPVSPVGSPVRALLIFWAPNVLLSSRKNPRCEGLKRSRSSLEASRGRNEGAGGLPKRRNPTPNPPGPPSHEGEPVNAGKGFMMGTLLGVRPYDPWNGPSLGRRKEGGSRGWGLELERGRGGEKGNPPPLRSGGPQSQTSPQPFPRPQPPDRLPQNPPPDKEQPPRGSRLGGLHF